MEQQTEIPQTDIVAGLAIVKAHQDGGWALPGGLITHCPVEAQAHCQALDRAIAELGGRARATRTGCWKARRRV